MNKSEPVFVEVNTISTNIGTYCYNNELDLSIVTTQQQSVKIEPKEENMHSITSLDQTDFSSSIKIEESNIKTDSENYKYNHYCDRPYIEHVKEGDNIRKYELIDKHECTSKFMSTELNNKFHAERNDKKETEPGGHHFEMVQLPNIKMEPDFDDSNQSTNYDRDEKTDSTLRDDNICELPCFVKDIGDIPNETEAKEDAKSFHINNINAFKHAEKNNIQKTNEGDTVYYKCDLCEKQFKSSYYLIDHRKSHTGDEPHVCEVCHKGFNVPSKLVRHMRTHTGERPYVCEVCNKRFADVSIFTIHKRTHTGEKPYVCDVCNKGFTASYTLVNHKRTHTGERPYICDVCQKNFTTASCLINHRRIHTGQKPFACDLCNKEFTTSPNLIKHKRTHACEKTFACDVCNKTFRSFNNLTAHQYIHTGNKPFVCDICNKAFTRLLNLNAHKLVHTGEKPYVCNVCNKACSDPSNLTKHKRIHTGEKPYVCNICDKPFSRSSNLQMHKRIHNR